MPPQTSPERALQAILPLITAGQAYEAHQKARTFGSRYLKAQAYDTAIQVLFPSARELLKGGHAGSGSDLSVFLIDVYIAKEQPIDAASRDQITQLIALTGPAGVWRKTIIDKAIAWTSEYGDSSLGDSLLHQYVGQLLYKEGDYLHAETHFLSAGNRDSARLLAEMMAEWLPADGSPGDFATHGVIPFLLLQNILAARTFLGTFLSLLRKSRPSLIPAEASTPITLPSESSTSKTEDEIFVTTDGTLNFLQLAIRACQRGNGETSEQQRDARNAWVRLQNGYRNKSSILSKPSVQQALMTLGNAYFAIPMPRQPGNPLQDMMASLFGGGGAGAGAGGGKGRGGPKKLRAAGGLD
ncbi:DUF410-domain-containing protein [Clavulina sp. PMI_390]|nr:DUF410-domain-containing protein [Clavulina sp. PMI_390]